MHFNIESANTKNEKTIEINIVDPKFIRYSEKVIFKKHIKEVHGEKELQLQVVNKKNAPAVVLDGQTYTLLQFHFHAPGEHLLENKKYPLEVHFVHKNEAGQLAVVGLLFALGKHNEAMQEVIDLTKKTAKKESAPLIPANIMLPKDSRVFRYSGSLTTPPYSENVKWQVFRATSEISETQLKEMQANGMLNAARETQALKGRTVVADSQAD